MRKLRQREKLCEVEICNLWQDSSWQTFADAFAQAGGDGVKRGPWHVHNLRKLFLLSDPLLCLDHPSRFDITNCCSSFMFSQAVAEGGLLFLSWPSFLPTYPLPGEEMNIMIAHQCNARKQCWWQEEKGLLVFWGSLEDSGSSRLPTGLHKTQGSPAESPGRVWPSRGGGRDLNTPGTGETNQWFWEQWGNDLHQRPGQLSAGFIS